MFFINASYLIIVLDGVFSLLDLCLERAEAIGNLDAKIECKSTKFSLNSQRFAEKLCINMGVNGSKQKTVFRNVVPLLLQGDGGFSGVQ